MTDEQAEQLINLLDELRDVIPIIETLGEAVLFRKNEADETFGLNKQTLSNSTSAERFEEVGARRVYISLKSLSVYRKKNRRKLKR